MKITKISVYKVILPLKDGPIVYGDGKVNDHFDSTVVKVDTDAGISGFGEGCPYGPSYMPSHPKGILAGLEELGPHVLGLDPLEIGKLNTIMDYHLKEHYDVKSPIDMACWDILGKHTKLPLCTLLGGRYGESVKLHYHVGQNTPEKTREIVTRFKNEGFECFQLKVGSNPTQDIQRVHEIRKMLDPSNMLMVDPNTAWLPHQAIRFANAVQDLDVYLEQPCASYEENLHVRRYTNLPFILDESTVDVVRLMQGGLGQVAQGVVLKMSRLGGVTKTKQARDLCVNLGIAARIEDPWGGEIASAAIAHLAHSTPEKYRIPAIDLNNYNSVKIAEGGPVRVNGTIAANKGPGLGITPCMDVLGDPVLTM